MLVKNGLEVGGSDCGEGISVGDVVIELYRKVFK